MYRVGIVIGGLLGCALFAGLRRCRCVRENVLRLRRVYGLDGAMLVCVARNGREEVGWRE
jgi:hypothetical protein